MGKDLFNPHLRKFSIRKLNIGVCSVLLATLVSVGTMTTANADENTALEDGTNELFLPKDKPQIAEVAASEVTTAATETVTAEAEQSAPQDLATTSEVATTPTSSTETSSPASNTIEEVVANSETSETASETPVATSENSEAPVATSSGLQDATPTPRTGKPSLADSERKLSEQLMKQVSWLEFGHVENFENLAPDGSFQVGTVFKKEISSGYMIRLTVTELKPFNSTEIYKNRVAGTEYENTYNPNAENTWLTFKKEPPTSIPRIIGASQNRWTAIKSEGIDTQGRKTQIQVPVDSANYGFKLKVEATYNGKPVKAAIVMADGEEANSGEFAIFTTNGTPWEYLAEWKRGSIIEPYEPMDPNITNPSILEDKTVHWQSYASPDQSTGGLGSQVFGPNISKDRTVPLIMTRDASEIGFYVASSGQQAAMIGVMVIDEGDAPESYGISPHMISTTNALTGVTTKQPYLGSVAADVDIKNKHDWQDDDKKDAADEGLTQLLSTDQLSKVNELFNFDLPEDGSYTLKVKASANGNSEAYMRAWIDFNQNGKFDDGEASDIVRVTETGDYTLTFTPDFSNIDKNIDRLGVRVRIALNQGDIEKPIGVAFSGEVEDLQILRTFPPKGDKQVTYGFKGESQTGTVHFTANGVTSLDYSKQATIDSTREPQVIATDGSVLQADNQGWYNLEEGRYKLTTQGDNVQVVFEPNADFTGTIKGLNIRRYDSNGASSNWQSQNQNTANVNDALNNMDGRFIPTILKYSEQTSTDVQGVAQTKELIFNDGVSDKAPVIPDATHSVQFLDASGNPVSETIVMATSNGQTVGTYELNAANGQVTFKPNKTFTGTTDPITFQLTDADGIRHRASYQATVTPLAPSSQNVTSEGIQGATQTGTLVFTSGDQRVPIDDKVLPTFDNGSQTKNVENVGTYTVDAQGKVTFQPLPSYTGRPDAQVVTRVDVNGTPIQATYQVEVKEAVPSAQNTTSTGLQGQAQSGHLTFSPGQAVINGETQKVDFNSDGLQFVINGQPQTGNALKLKDAQDKLLGVYILHPNGDIQFQPSLDYVGVPEPARVRATDLNGRTVEATYSPTITAVTPTGSDATSTGQQGQVQMGRPEFTAGDPSVPLDDTVAATFDDGSQRKEVLNVGVFTVAFDGTVTFTPVQDYVGTADAVTVKRVDKNGTPVTARYTATVTATPKAMTTETTGKQGQVQEGTLSFPGSDAGVTYPANSTPVFDNGTTVKEVPNVGKFELDAQGKVTFTPEKQFVGESPAVEISRTDDQGVVHKTTYKATVAAVTPTGSDATSTGQQGQVQMGRLEFTAGDPSVPLDDTVAATFDDGSQRKEVPNVGVFTVASDGTVTFTPEKDYVGTADAVTVKRVDKNGTPVTARYTATVTVPATGKDVISVGNKGQAQMAKPVFEGSIDDKVRPTFEDGTTEKTISGEGTYSIDPDGIVTFTPDSNFVGTGKGVVVKRVDTNGNAVLANYAPTVIGTAFAKNDTTTGAKGQTQTSNSLFSGDIDLAVLPTFEDGTTEKIVLGEGVYRLDPNGIVTFTPDPNFVGQAKGVTVVRKDRNGNTISATYTPTTTESAMTPERNTASVQLSATDKNVGQNSSHQVSNMSMNGERLPNTGTKDDSMLGAAALTSIAGISLLGLARRKKASEE